MIQWQGMAIGGVAVAILAFAGGAKVGSTWSASEHRKEIVKIEDAAGKLIDRQIDLTRIAEAERDQAKAEVDKVNRATAVQYAELKSLMTADQSARMDAAVRMEKAAQQAAKDARTAGERAREGLEVIKRVADVCARADVPADVKRVLDGILAGPGAPVVDR